MAFIVMNIVGSFLLKLWINEAFTVLGFTNIFVLIIVYILGINLSGFSWRLVLRFWLQP